MTQPVLVCPFDVHLASPELWTWFHACRRAVAADVWPDDPVLSDAESQIELQQTHPLYDCPRWIALLGEEVIGSARAFYRRPGTPHASEHGPHLFGGITVRPEARRLGAGSLLLGELHALMNALDKTVLTLMAHTPPGQAFLAHIGAAAKLAAVESRAALRELDWVSLRQWEASAEDLGLVWESYSGRVPRERMLALHPTFTTFLADMPLDELSVPPSRAEIEGFDLFYQTLDRSGGSHHLIVLHDAEGAVAGLTEAVWDSRTPSRVFQQFTAVARAWRGRGLAHALKARILRQVHACHPEAEFMATSNAESNAAMRAVNTRAGFKAYRRTVEYQITQGELTKWRERDRRFQQ